MWVKLWNLMFSMLISWFILQNESTTTTLGYLLCQMPKDALEVELKIKTKWGKFTLHMDQFTRTEKFRAWRKVNRCKIHSRRRQHHMSDSHQNVSSESGTFINNCQGLGFPPKIFIDSDMDKAALHMFQYWKTIAEHAW